MPLKVGDNTSINLDKAIEAISYAIENGANIINMSWGSSTHIYQNLKVMIEDAFNEGLILVAAAHNQNSIIERYPSALPEVMAVAGLEPDDRKREGGNGSNYGEWIHVSAPHLNYTTKDGTSNYYQASATSTASPYVAGLAALILSVNPNLSNQQVYDIIYDTADNIDDMNPDYIGLLGGGKINVVRALYKAQRMSVEEHMVNYKSINDKATATNTGRRSYVHNGVVHYVFSSGSDIVYFNQPPWGSVTQPLIISEYQTSDIGRNELPVISISDDGTIHVVWQRKTYGAEEYKVIYTQSQDSGTTWSSETILNTSIIKPEPQVMGSYDDDEFLMVVYRYHDGIHALKWNTMTSVWDSWHPSDSLIPGTHSYHKSPAVTPSRIYGMSGANIAYTDDFHTNIFYQCYDTDYNAWLFPANLSTIVPGAATHHTPSISNSPANGSERHLAWVRTTGSGSGAFDNKIIHRWSTHGGCGWPNVYSSTYYQLQKNPSIAGIGSNKALLLYDIQHLDSIKGIAKQQFNGNYWSAPSQITLNGSFPSVSPGGVQARFIYTESIGSPFNLVTSNFLSMLNSENYIAGSESIVYKRSIAFMDSLGSYFELIVHDVQRIIADGQVENLDLINFDQNNVDISIDKVLDLFSFNNTDIGDDTIRFELEIRAHQAEKLFSNNSIPDVVVPDNIILAPQSEIKLSVKKIGIERFQRNSESNNSRSVNLRKLFILDHMEFNEHVFASVGHLYEKQHAHHIIKNNNIDNSIDTLIGDGILSNYPNPFNPVTNIIFKLQDSENVILSVYDITGRLVSTLVDEVKEPGQYTVLFDGSRLASGIYFYRLQYGSNVRTKRMTLIK